MLEKQSKNTAQYQSQLELINYVYIMKPYLNFRYLSILTYLKGWAMIAFCFQHTFLYPLM